MLIKNFKENFKKLNKKILNLKNIQPGMLGGSSEKYWVQDDDKQYLFKYLFGKNDYSDFGEVFTSYICQMLNVKCVKSIFCDDLFESQNNKSGVLIESYRDKTVKESISLASLLEKYKRRHFAGYTVNEIVEVVKEFCFDNKILFDINLEQELKEMALMDYLLIQTDRHAHNIEFLVVEIAPKIKKIKLAPMFDNGFCLHLLDSNKDAIKILQRLLVKTQEISYKITNPKPKFYIEESENIFDDAQSIVRDLAKELRRNRKLMRLYENFCKIDLEEEIAFVEDLRKEPITSLKRNLITYGIKNRIKLLNNELLHLMHKENNLTK